MAQRQGLLEERLRDLVDAPPSELKVAQFLASQTLGVPFLSAQAIADQVGVSKATVLRTVKRLGFSSVGNLREYIRRTFFDNSGSPLARAKLPDQDLHEPQSLVEACREREIANLRSTLSRVDSAALHELASDLTRARTVFVYGHRYSFALAYHLWLRLAALLPNVRLVHGLGGTAADIVCCAGPKDYAILFAHRRVGREKELLAAFLRRRRCPYAVVTDAYPTSVSVGAKHCFLVTTRGVGAFNSYVSSLALAQLIGLAVERNLGKVVDALARSEEAWAQLDIFVKG